MTARNRLTFILTTSCLLIALQCGVKESVKPDDSIKVYSGLQLSRLQVPVGGIGTGDVRIGGRGHIAHIEVFNRPDRRRKPYKTFFALYTRSGGGPSQCRLLEGELLPPYDSYTHEYLEGLPRFREVTFNNRFPLPRWSFRDPAAPLQVELEAFNPYVPLDVDNSSFPAAAFYWSLYNPGPEPVEASVLLGMENMIRADSLVNSYYADESFTGVRLAASGDVPVNFRGAMLAGTTAGGAQVQTGWYPGQWRDDAHVLWDDFSRDGKLEPRTIDTYGRYRPVDYNETSGRNFSVLAPVTLQPGERVVLPFYLFWYFPEREFGPAETFGNPAAAGRPFRNYYATLFSGESDVLRRFLLEEKELRAHTERFAASLEGPGFPPYVGEALRSQAAVLKTHLIQVTDDGDVHGFEGVGEEGWCCPGTCTHVWNYAQALASLFPSLERSMRRIEFEHNTSPNGFQAHRSLFPLGPYLFDGPAAADGQMGSIVRLYREWKMSGDTEWLRALWPNARKALEFAWQGAGKVHDPALKYQESQEAWDPRKRGALSGRQHNTYDISFYGPNSMTSSLYLAALKAGAEMASALGQAEQSGEYAAIYRAGKRYMEDSLWNGEYFIQILEEDPSAGRAEGQAASALEGHPPVPKYQYGDGCLADQLLGQYLAWISGLGPLLDETKISSALKSVYDYNFIPQLRDFANVQRVYALNDEAGVVLCSWPRGNRPLFPFVYADEIWTGVEYQVAASLIYAGRVEDGLRVVRAVQERHDGFRRNPFDHAESGGHYARGLAAWSVLTALTGFGWDGTAEAMSFAPAAGVRTFTAFWSTGQAWGTLQLDRKKAILRVEYGRLRLRELALRSGQAIEVVQPGAVVAQEDGRSIARFDPVLDLPAGDGLEITFQ
jgi:non-lysosomal glucosylceramidase